MSLFEQWKEQADRQRTKAEHDRFWNAYLEKETDTYGVILENHSEAPKGRLGELADRYGMDAVTFTGFLDGINTSLVNSLNLEELTEDSEISLDIDFEKLYRNMLDAKASWLYNLPQWDNVLPEERRKEITRDFNRSRIAVSNKVGRNDPCPCGSGIKYKKCCGK
jgi:hypothetical protein